MTPDEQADVDQYESAVRELTWYTDQFLEDVYDSRLLKEIGGSITEEHAVALIRVVELERLRRYAERTP